MQSDCLRLGKFELRQRLFEYRNAFHDAVENSCRYHVVALVWRRQVVAQLSGNRVGSQVLELPRIGANESLWNQPNPNEALAVLVRLRPRVGPSVVAGRAGIDKQRLALEGFLAVDLSQHFFRPFWGRQSLK